MPKPSTRTPDPGLDGVSLIPLFLLFAALALTVIAWIALGLAGQPVRPNPLFVLIDLATGALVWTGKAVLIMAGLTSIIVIALVFIVTTWVGHGRGGNEFTHRGRMLGTPKTAGAVTQRQAMHKAQRWGMHKAGIIIGRFTTHHHEPIVMSWEDVSVTIAGMRSGKTQSLAIPIVAQAPGPVIATSNKPDIVQATTLVRQSQGTIWLFDPQHVVTTNPPEWWWDFLGVCDSISAAKEMAAQLIAASREAGAKGDFWDTEARDLLSYLLFAGHLADQQLPMVFRWVNNESDDRAARILTEAGYSEAAQSLRAILNTDPKTRAGIYVTAKQAMAWMTDPHIARWVTCDPADTTRFARAFDPAAFAVSHDTLYLCSEKRGGSGPLVAAFTLAVCQKAVEVARRYGGYLPTPMQVVLDECANICRIADLPDQMSHFGSHHIQLHPIFQNKQQIVNNWGETGVGRLFAAANFAIVGSGVNDAAFLTDISNLVGTYDRLTVSRSSSYHGPGSMTRSTTKEHILPVSELRAIPPFHALILAAGTPPITAKLMAWQEYPFADQIAQSLAAYKGR